MTSFERHAFSGLDTEAKSLQATLDQIRAHIGELLDYLLVTLDAPQQGYGPAKEIDKKINELEIETNKKVYDIVTKYTPLGEEMRYVFSMVKVSYIYESIADKLKNSIKRRCRIAGPLPSDIKASLEAMVSTIQKALARAHGLLESFDASGMQELAELKRAASMHQKQAFAVLQGSAAGALTPQESTDTFFVIKNVERVSDQLLDLGKVVYFIVHGTKFERDDEAVQSPA